MSRRSFNSNTTALLFQERSKIDFSPTRAERKRKRQRGEKRNEERRRDTLNIIGVRRLWYWINETRLSANQSFPFGYSDFVVRVIRAVVTRTSCHVTVAFNCVNPCLLRKYSRGAGVRACLFFYQKLKNSGDLLLNILERTESLTSRSTERIKEKSMEKVKLIKYFFLSLHRVTLCRIFSRDKLMWRRDEILVMQISDMEARRMHRGCTCCIECEC